MGVHKLTAGDGYTYLTRQVAAHDATDRGHSGLADYYAEKGESPGQWFGSGLRALDLEVSSVVTEAQMRSLFGEGRHPEAARIEEAALDAGQSLDQAKRASRLGRVFTRHLGNQPEFIQETARRYTAYNLAHGVHWRTPVPPEVRAAIRTDLGNELFVREHGRAPIDDRERGSFMAKATRQQTTAVAGYDLTFAPVKSVSTLWALADRAVAEQIAEAHQAAVEATLSWLEQEVLFTRRGRGGIQQVKTRGLVAAVFVHRDARSSDPHLHTHVALSNKVQDQTGRWLAVDGRVLFKANVTLSETYNTLVEAELVARLGVRFEDRHPGSGARSERTVREIVGVDDRLADTWSRRRHAIEARRRDLAAAFQSEHGRPPTEGEAVTLAEKAWEQTRQAKHAPRAEAEQRAAWSAEATAILGSERAVRDMVKGCLGHRLGTHQMTAKELADTAGRVVSRVAEDRATWQVWHLRAEAMRQVRPRGMRGADLDDAVDRVVSAAIEQHSVALDDPDPLASADTAAQWPPALDVTIPAPLQRTDRSAGRSTIVSVYSLAGARQYTSRAVVEAERRIVDSARRTGGRTISDVRVGIAIAEAAANGFELNGAQRSLVRAMTTSGRATQLVMAPAGTGKTSAMRALTRAWQDSGGTVIGLAPSAVAAHELGSSIAQEADDSDRTARARRLPSWSRRAGRTGVHADTLAKLAWHARNGRAPSWMTRINGTTMVLIDEAGMAATTELAVAIDYITSRGGQVRLVGDDRQLASVAAGGVLRDIAHNVGAVTLSEVHRFRHRDGSINHAEAAATLALRTGDPSAVAYYADRGRIHVGDLGSCADQAYAAWAADRGAGTDSVLIAPTRDLVAELNARARNDRLRDLDEREIGAVLALADGTSVSAGDRIITRENDRRLRLNRTNWVKNGDRWHVVSVNADGSLRAAHDELGSTITLPAAYVATSVQLGYATTVHGAQGLTTGTCHVVLTGDEDRNLLYVALSRGRYANHLYLDVASDGDPHNLIRPEALLPPTALDRLAQMLRRDGSAVSATTTLRESADPLRLLGDLCARYHDAVTAGAEHLIGTAGMDKIDAHADALLPGLSEMPAWPTLRSHLALAALNQHDPTHLLTEAVAVGPLTDAHDPAAVLDARVDALLPHRDASLGGTHQESVDTPPPRASLANGPLPWLPGIPALLSESREWGPFATAYHRLVVEQVDIVREEARHWAGPTAPVWAQPFLDEEDAPLRADLAVWRAVAKTDDNDLRPTGDRAIGAPGAHQAQLKRAARTAHPSYPFAQRTWYHALPDVVRADPWAIPLCQRLARLERAGLPVIDYIAQALASDPSLPVRTALSSGSSREAVPPRPLPDDQQAAALWWRMVPQLGPAAVAADRDTGSLLQPEWHASLAELVGTARAQFLTRAPAWPALVAAVDEACEHHGWTPTEVLASALSGIPRDGSLTGVEVAGALVLRIAMLTDRAPDAQVEQQAVTLPDPAATHVHFAAEPHLPLLAATAEEVTAEDAFPRPGQVPASRIVQLNQLAHAYFESCYPKSWAPDYLRTRLGTDLLDQSRYSAGYAPNGGQSLIRHLTRQGASLDELEQAGLISSRERRDGTTYYTDFFRDRLILPILDPHSGSDPAIVGFIGRRNPTRTDDDHAGPKYLNTRTTTIFTKGEALYGYAEAHPLLTHGALPVLVEGPLDALAVTLGSHGTAAGIAPMGTALTTAQVELLRATVDVVNDRNHVAVCTDSDPAGRMSAHKAFWLLTAADLDPTQLRLPAGSDPASLIELHGSAALSAAIRDRLPLGDRVVDELLTAEYNCSSDTQDHQIRQVAQVLAARGPDVWLEAFTRLRDKFGLPPGIIEHLTILESIRRDHHPARYAEARIDEINANARTRSASHSTGPGASPRSRTDQHRSVSSAPADHILRVDGMTDGHVVPRPLLWGGPARAAVDPKPTGTPPPR